MATQRRPVPKACLLSQVTQPTRVGISPGMLIGIRESKMTIWREKPSAEKHGNGEQLGARPCLALRIQRAPPTSDIIESREMLATLIQLQANDLCWYGHGLQLAIRARWGWAEGGQARAISGWQLALGVDSCKPPLFTTSY
ncbi:hypothetical protein L1887_47712 [Cichorium endivia]|nr:hypothetical protein L1887_47712 [Cichorium endivia]